LVAKYLQERGASWHDIGIYLSLMNRFNPESMFRSFRKTICHFVQIKNPINDQYVKVDTKTGRIVSRKNTPYKNIPINSSCKKK